jgi:hypothetical protein
MLEFCTTDQESGSELTQYVLADHLHNLLVDHSAYDEDTVAPFLPMKICSKIIEKTWVNYRNVLAHNSLATLMTLLCCEGETAWTSFVTKSRVNWSEPDRSYPSPIIRARPPVAQTSIDLFHLGLAFNLPVLLYCCSLICILIMDACRDSNVTNINVPKVIKVMSSDPRMQEVAHPLPLFLDQLQPPPLPCVAVTS